MELGLLMANKVSPFDSAMENTLKRIGAETDQSIIAYNKLQPTNFRALQRRYGFDNVQRYIRVMEAKRAGIDRILRR